jgi:predicted secreted protein
MMAEGQQIGRTLLIQIGDGQSPEAFTNLCGITTRSFNLSANEVDTTIPDCNNPGGPVQRTAEPGIVQRKFTGSGKFYKGPTSSIFMAHVRNATVFNAKVIVPGDGTYTGPWMASEFEFSGEMEGNMDFSATISAAGPLTFVDEA